MERSPTSRPPPYLCRAVMPPPQAETQRAHIMATVVTCFREVLDSNLGYPD
jgi:hypothetical protein